jgi:hypothetical protein
MIEHETSTVFTVLNAALDERSHLTAYYNLTFGEFEIDREWNPGSKEYEAGELWSTLLQESDTSSSHSVEFFMVDGMMFFSAQTAPMRYVMMTLKDGKFLVCTGDVEKGVGTKVEHVVGNCEGNALFELREFIEMNAGYLPAAS